RRLRCVALFDRYNDHAISLCLVTDQLDEARMGNAAERAVLLATHVHFTLPALVPADDDQVDLSRQTIFDDGRCELMLIIGFAPLEAVAQSQIVWMLVDVELRLSQLDHLSFGQTLSIVTGQSRARLKLAHTRCGQF